MKSRTRDILGIVIWILILADICLLICTVFLNIFDFPLFVIVSVGSLLLLARAFVGFRGQDYYIDDGREDIDIED